MSMNSFSFRAARGQNTHLYEEEISGLLELHQDGEVFAFGSGKELQPIPFSPLDFSDLRAGWLEPDGRRSTCRFELSATVLIVNHRQAFKTQSINVSATGIFIKDLLPEEFSNHHFDIVIVKKNQAGKKDYFFFRGRAVEGRLRSARIKFDGLTPDSRIKLQKLFSGLSRAI